VPAVSAAGDRRRQENTQEDAQERSLASEVLAILREDGQPVPMARLCAQMTQSTIAKAHMRRKYGRGMGAFKSFLMTSSGLKDVQLVSILF
jgi:hypothetical protein